MKKLYKSFQQAFIATIILLVVFNNSNAQSCTPQGNPATYGTGNTWIGYLYTGTNFNTYKGYITEGNSSAAFDESFSGAQVNFATNGCPVYTDGFSARFRLTKTFAAGGYTITVGGDDGYRLSLDGGNTWVINKWNDQSYNTSTYTVYLSGSYNLVLEYYENGGDNRVTFSTASVCLGSENTAVYGSNNTWIGYMYQGMNFDQYKGYINKGTSTNPNFDENFGGGSSAVTVNTSSCSFQTQSFSARYRLQKTFPAGSYMFTIGGDDGYRFSLDGGATWVVNKWVDQSYGITSYTVNLNGTYNMILEYYQNAGYSRVSFNMTVNSLLPVKLVSFAAIISTPEKSQLNWTITEAANFKNFTVQRSLDGNSFSNLQVIAAQNSNSSATQNYTYTDAHAAINTIYYRLAMTDIDGSITYSNIIRLDNETTTTVKVYPTLVENKNVYVESGKAINHAKATVYDMNGRKMMEQTLENVQGRQSIALNAGVKNGTYIISVTDGTNQLAKQIILVK